MKSTRTILGAISFLSLLCLVIADHHRIIIEERVPRTQKGRRNERHKSNGTKGGNRARKVPKKTREVDETSSFDGNGQYSSEEYFLQKYQDSSKPHSSKHSHPHPIHFANLNFEESRSPQTITGWSPLGSDPTQKQTPNKSRHDKKPKKQPLSKIPQTYIEPTPQRYPTIHIQEDGSTLDPAMFSPHNPFVGVEQFTGLDHLKSGEVVYDYNSAGSNLRPFVVVQGDNPEGENSEQESLEEPEVEVTTHRPRRSRSRGKRVQRNKKNH